MKLGSTSLGLLVRCLLAVAVAVWAPSPATGQPIDYSSLDASVAAIAPAEAVLARDGYVFAKTPVIWTGRSLTIGDLAAAAAPILWFSPREPLLGPAADSPIPVRIPSFGPFLTTSTMRRTVFYRVRQIVVHSGSHCRSNLEQELRQSPRISEARWTNDCANDSLPLEALDRIYIRYMFYYPSEEGTGAHEHDLEALEIEISLRTNLDAAIGAARIKIPSLFQAIVLSASGSAHGVGWYTNVLNLEGTRDFVFPLTVLVEEGKHASAPDRDGDGDYKPHYDVNVQSNDAWGVRDTLRTKRLGGSAFGAHMLKRRETRERVFPATAASTPFVVSYFKARDENVLFAQRYLEATRRVLAEERGGPDASQVLATSDGPWVYQLTESPMQEACQPIVQAGLPTELRYLMDGKGFCDAPRVVDASSSVVSAFAKAWNTISPGPKSRYGFMNEWQRLSFAYRNDGGHGVAVVVPLGLEVPGFGGWMLLKTNAIFTTLRAPVPPPVQRGSLEVLYTPSASRIVDWYVAVGGESEAAESTLRTWQTVGELGLKFRFSLEKIRLVRFFGGRVAVRSNDLKPFTNTRLVFEFGAGSW